MKLVIPFTYVPVPSLAEVGGKGLSLIRMAQAGLAVPPGVVLAVEFFEPWFAELRRSPEWSAFVAVAREELQALKPACDALKARCSELALSDAQRAEVAAAAQLLPADALLAVRSSSPEEDLEGSSFAGGYETVLGVRRQGLDAAIRRAFASCLDARVAVYKREHGFDPASPRIAIVVQQQIASEIAGVGFSLNPITNAYDEAVLSSNWGLGESVVAGLASPDVFVVDRPARRIVEKRVGKKETSIWLRPEGGTEERADPRHSELTLTDAQVLALAEQLERTEALYGKPMDIEWAFAGGALHLLQARPITTHLELPQELVTAPGERKRLYWDLTIGIQGVLRPMSPMGTSLVALMISSASKMFLGKDFTRRQGSVVRPVAGRIYVDLGRPIAVAGIDRLAYGLPAADPLTARAIVKVDAAQYAGPRRPPFRFVLRFPGLLMRVLRATLFPDGFRAAIDRLTQEGIRRNREMAKVDLPSYAVARELISPSFMKKVFTRFIPAILTWRITMERLKKMFPDDERRKLARRLDQSLPGNVTVEMGLELARVARLVPAGASVDALPPEAAQALALFLDKYGHRGAGELDVANPRYREQPKMIHEQLQALARTADPEKLPDAIYARSRREREAALEALAKIAGSRRRERRVRKLAHVVERLGGVRETPKFILIQAFDLVRKRLLVEAARLVAAGRLDRVEQIFELTIDDVEAGLKDPGLNLRAIAAERSRPIRKLQRVKDLPRLIDSRGRIFHPPPPPSKDGELVGMAVSAGVARGPVKVLHAPDEKPLLPGDVLVARATDPGWTPLFVNAAAVVLEVGGSMQHGALVAREYGKPCVSGVEDATGRLKDGQLVEVDGAAGVVRLVKTTA